MFASDLDKASQAQLNRGQRLTEILKQDQYKPLPFSKPDYDHFCGHQRHLDDIPVNQCREFEKGLYTYIEATNPELFETIETKKALDEPIKADMNKAMQEFKETFVRRTQSRNRSLQRDNPWRTYSIFGAVSAACATRGRSPRP